MTDHPVDRLAPVLDRADQLYVGVGTSTGPHVTPELFACTGGRIVCLTAASTLKAKCSRRDGVVAVAGRAGSHAFTALATADVVDPVDPTTAVAAPGAAVAAPVAVARFVRDNAAELAGAAMDAISGRLGIPPARRVVLVLDIVAAAMVDGDGLVFTDGWASVAAGPDGDDARVTGDVDLEGVPDDLAALAEPADVVLGWTSPDGAPRALPARWHDATAVDVDAALFDATGAAPTSPACVTFDAWTGFGPSGKQGLMLRGQGQVRDTGRVAIDVDRVSYWDGVVTGSTRGSS